MRRKIWRMSEGQFSKSAPKLRIEPENLQETIAEGDSFSGSFTVLCDENTPTKGLVYSDNPYIYIITPAFNEENPVISFRITATHLRAGDVISGKFYIYADATVRTLDFYFDVVKKLPISSYGKIDSLESFAELAKRSWKEALEIFYHEDFARVVKNKASKDINLLYRGFSKAARLDANLEEFLATSGLKERMTFDLDTSSREYSFVSTNRKETIDITRNTWGYIRLKVTSDADFITVENNVLTNDFFLGSKLSLNFYIHKELLHAGKNYCRITISGMGIVKTIEIVASTTDLHERHNEEYLEFKKAFLKLYTIYEDFRIKKIDSSAWASRSVELCDMMLNMPITRDRLLLRLIKTHALVVNGQQQLALEIVKNLRVDINDKKSFEWAYLLYLGALLEPEEEYVIRLRKEIEAILELHPEDVRIFWFLLFLKKEYIKSNPEKLRAIRHWMSGGFDSPLLYAECYEIYLEDPYLIGAIDEINYKVLNWAVKHKALTKGMAERIFDLLYKEISIKKNIYPLLKSAYDKSPKEAHLKALISYLLRQGAKDPQYTDIYALGIEKNIRLAGLFEAYIESLPLDYMKPLSDLVLRYFSYNSTVSPERKAFVYANIIMYKNQEPGYYDSNKRRIHEFCIEQMRENNLDNNLVVCYQDCIDYGIIDSRMADSVQNILYMKKVISFIKDARRVIAVEEELKEPAVALINDNMTFVPIYSDDYRIFIELNDGRIITDENLFYVESTINKESSYQKLKVASTVKHRFLLRDLAIIERYEELESFYMEEAEEYLYSDDIDPEYLRRHFHIFLGYFKDLAREDVLLNALLHNDRYREYDNGILTYLSSLLMIDKKQEEALSIFREYLINDADKRQLLGLIKNIVKDPAEPKGEFILELCVSLLRDGYHSDETIEYLLCHFIGTVDDMRNVFKYANPDSPYLPDFCERFIIQGLYVENIDRNDDEILIAYLDHSPNPMVVEAYISYFCHLYLKEDIMPPDSVFAILFRQVKLTDNINDACRFGYSKYLCTKKDISRQEMELLDILIREQLLRNIYFPFYKEMDDNLSMKYHLYDRMYASFEGQPKGDLVLSIKSNGQVLEYDMIESYPGIYVRDMMIFFGENLSYNIYDRRNPKESLAIGEFNYQDVGMLSESRFYLINHLEEQLFYKEEDNLKKGIEKYHNMISAQRNIFKTL